MYRDWVTDHSGLINYDLLRGTAGPRGLLGGAANTISFGTLASLGVSGLSGPSLALPGLARCAWSATCCVALQQCRLFRVVRLLKTLGDSALGTKAWWNSTVHCQDCNPPQALTQRATTPLCCNKFEQACSSS